MATCRTSRFHPMMPASALKRVEVIPTARRSTTTDPGRPAVARYSTQPSCRPSRCHPMLPEAALIIVQVLPPARPSTPSVPGRPAVGRSSTQPSRLHRYPHPQTRATCGLSAYPARSCMSLSSVSIRRPVLATVFSIVIVIFGLISLTRLGIREYPVVESPVIVVSTSYTGASAHVIEREVTERLEEQINAVSGIRTLSSESREGRSMIRVEFNPGVDIEVAANDVRDRVGRAIENLPDDANPPSVRKEDPDSEPIVFLNINSDVRDRLELTQIARDVFRERLRTIEGVSIVSVWGQQRYAMRLWLDPALMAAYHVTPLDTRTALSRENAELPSGVIEGDMTELTIRTMGRLSEVDEFRNLIIREEAGNVVRFADIGRVELGTRDDRTVLKRDGEAMVGVVAIPQPGSNQIAAAREIHRRVEQIKAELPPDIEVSVAFDRTEHVLESIAEVRSTILLAFVLVVLVIFLFLRNLRSTLIPVVVVPIALVGSFFIMFIFGFSINILTLLALVLAIGLVVDDAIIVLENIYAKMESGMPAMEAGIKGAQEIL